MKTNAVFVHCIFIVIILTCAGCATGGMFPSTHVTDVTLQKNNFKIVARDITGESKAGYIFGQTLSMGMATNTIAVARINGTGMLYKEAMENLWKNFEAVNGPVGDRKIALINVRYDSDALNLFVYTEARIMIRADIVEFTE